MAKNPEYYNWRRLARQILAHRRELVSANLIAVLATLAAVPVPLLLPVLVDEVLLGEPGPVVPLMQSLLPENWARPAVYIFMMVGVALALRVASLGLNVWQTRQFTRISKDIVFRMRERLLGHLGRVSMREYEQLGSGAVASRLVTDLNTIDDFLGTTISRFIIALLTILGTASVLLWVHWQLGLLIILLNPVVILVATRIGRHVKALKKAENQATEVFQGVLT
ncbi:MAG: ABC transporter ATP-binding protein, partial [Gammaproteobacteria bacterium]